MTLLHTTLIVSFAALAVLRPASVSAASCTDDEQSTINSVYTDLTNSTMCTDLISNSDTTFLDYCKNSGCISKLSTAVDQLPSCTEDYEINRKAGLQDIVEYCIKVQEMTNQSAPGENGTESVVSGASRSALATGVLTAQLCAALYFFA